MKCSVLGPLLVIFLTGSIFSAFPQTTLVSTGAVWRYLDDGSSPNEAWRLATFNDASWASGRAQLGYGDGDEATTNRFGPDAANKHITTYYRHSFSAPSDTAVTNLALRLLRDDGAVVYLNGAEAYRSNMPTGEVTAATLAVRAIGGAEELNFLQAMLNPSLLVPGTNLLAVEIHQVTNSSTDISFDLALVANSPMRPALVHLGSVWKYRDDGNAPEAQWRDLLFDDTAWPNGPAQLGYGDGDEITRINSGPAANVFLAYYFRHVFDVLNPAAFSNLVVRVLRDDGAIVYLNGTEIFRNNMPAGPVGPTTLADAVVNTPQESQFYATRVDPLLLRAGLNVLAVEIHQGSATSSDVSFDLELLPNIPVTLPEISITTPMNNATYIAPADISITAAATDFDGVVTNVSFFVNSELTGQSASEPFDIVCSNHPVGTHTLLAIATDDLGQSTTSAPVSVRIAAPAMVVNLVTNGSWWTYLDDGSDPDPSWPTPGFVDSSWLGGFAEFGYGELDQATTIRGGEVVPRTISAYFRHKFRVSRASEFTNLLARVLRDDGVVVYLNGQEAFRMNMPPGPIGYLTYASTPVGSTNETFYFPTNISASLLVEGENTLAVELHQTANSGDASFDMSLIAIGPPRSTLPALTVERVEGRVRIGWAQADVWLEERILPDGPWVTITNAPNPTEFDAPTDSRLFRLRQR